RLILKTVSRPDFHDFYFHIFSTSTVFSPTETTLPVFLKISLILPSKGAFRAYSIFIASITQRVSPDFTGSPFLKLMRRIFPGIGETRTPLAAVPWLFRLPPLDGDKSEAPSQGTVKVRPWQWIQRIESTRKTFSFMGQPTEKSILHSEI